MTLYGLPNCNTVKKAQDALKINNVAYTFHDFKKKGITKEKLQEWFDAFGWEKVINKQGLTFKKLNAAEKEAINSAAAAIEYLLNNTSAIKRPVLEQNGRPISIGFNEDIYAKFK